MTFNLPTPGSDDNTWGDELNAVFNDVQAVSSLDASVAAKVANVSSATNDAVEALIAADISTAVPAAVATALASVASNSFPIAATTGLQTALDDLEAGQSDVAHAGDALSTFTGLLGTSHQAAGTVFYVLYNFGTSAWPVRPTARTDMCAIWLGPLTDAPTIGGTGMLDGTDVFLGVDA